jgi:hypothetical protein
MTLTYTVSTNFSSPTTVYQYLVASAGTIVQNGLDRTGVTSYEGLFINLDGGTLKPRGHRAFLNPNELVTADTATHPGHFRSFPIGAWTDAEGITTLLCEELAWVREREKGVYYRNTKLTGLHFIQLDANGEQIFDTTVAKQQHLDNHLYPVEVVLRPCNKYLFRDIPGQQSDNQLMSAVWWKTGPSLYTVFNDASDNFERAAGAPITPVRNPRFAEPVLCRFSPANHQLEKWRLFGTVPPGEARACLLESAHFDMASKRLAALVVHTQSGKQAMRMAWTTLP